MVCTTREFIMKVTDTTESYLEKQQRKLEKHRAFIDSCQDKFRNALRDRIKPYESWLSGKSVLCIAARLGTEVRVFWEYGCFAVGIDLNPGGISETVLKGDFHKLLFPQNCVDVVYTNSFDHALYPDGFLVGIRQVLKPDGSFILEASRGIQEGYKFDSYDVNRWDYVSQVADRVERTGFKLISERPFKIPWPGVHYLWHC